MVTLKSIVLTCFLLGVLGRPVLGSDTIGCLLKCEDLTLPTVHTRCEWTYRKKAINEAGAEVWIDVNVKPDKLAGTFHDTLQCDVVFEDKFP